MYINFYIISSRAGRQADWLWEYFSKLTVEGVLKAQCNKWKHQLFPRPTRMKTHFKIHSNSSLESMESEDNYKSSNNSDCELNEFQIDNHILTQRATTI